MLKKTVNFVLASLRGSTLSRSVSEVKILEGLFRLPRPIIRIRANGHTKCGTYLLDSSLAVALLAGIFEHSTGTLLSFVTCKGCRAPKSFALSVGDRVSIDRHRRVHA